MNAKMLKSLAVKAGVDLCGIAPVERFREAPEGFRPADIYPSAKSVFVFAKRVPQAALLSRSPVPYKFACDVVLDEVFRITCDLSLRLQDLGVAAVPVPSEPYEYWDVEKNEGRGILSLKHAGYLAGLGIMGKNTLLTNNKLGNRITLGALLLNLSLKGDPIAKYRICKSITVYVTPRHRKWPAPPRLWKPFVGTKCPTSESREQAQLTNAIPRRHE